MTSSASPELAREAARVEAQEAELPRTLGVTDLVLAQVLYVVGSAWVGAAAKLGQAQVVYWSLAIVLYYVPQAAVVIWLNRRMPLEGGLYQWVKIGLGETWGFFVAWNLWVYTIVLIPALALSVATTLAYTLGAQTATVAASKTFDLTVTAALVTMMAGVAIVGLRAGKWVHNLGGVTQLLAFAALIGAPFLARARGTLPSYHPLQLALPVASLFSLNIMAKMGMGALSGFEWVAILAGESRHPERSVARSVVLATPMIAMMFVLGTSAVMAFVPLDRVDLIAPIPQTLRVAYGGSAFGATIVPALVLLMGMRIVANCNLLFTGNTRLPMVAGWDGLLPAWFTRLHPLFRTPLNSIVFVSAVLLALAVVGLAGVGQQEAFQMLDNAAGVLYALAYLVMFALPIVAARRLGARPPRWLQLAAASGFGMTLLYTVLSIVPIVDVVSRWQFAAKIIAVIIGTNLLGALILGASRRRGAGAQPTPSISQTGV